VGYYPDDMPLLSAAENTRAAARLANLPHPVRLHLFTQALDCESCDDTRRLLADLAALAPRLIVDEHNLVLDRDLAASLAVDRAPAIAVVGDADAGIRFLGAPVGHELSALLDAIVMVSARDSGLSAASREKLAGLSSPVAIQVFSTPTCVYCSQAVALAHRAALESAKVSATGVSVIEFPDLIRRHRVTGVPKIVLNDRVELLGAQPEAVFIDAILEASLEPLSR
jgi:glutaredoxin-like protein